MGYTVNSLEEMPDALSYLIKSGGTSNLSKSPAAQAGKCHHKVDGYRRALCLSSVASGQADRLWMGFGQTDTCS